ncbi:hypothetical protein PR048_007033 [Dryococelus australis]|uniref:Uncharacterized protein n=1 Tax=Dryococelus australis TaxID=614101 RepID=A0ABQ9ID30_9NEOP|nr:hypothetical protein PR048_007033 [Dryococelus australis]
MLNMTDFSFYSGLPLLNNKFADLPWRNRLVRCRSGVREVLGSNPRWEGREWLQAGRTKSEALWTLGAIFSWPSTLELDGCIPQQLFLSCLHQSGRQLVVDEATIASYRNYGPATIAPTFISSGSGKPPHDRHPNEIVNKQSTKKCRMWATLLNFSSTSPARSLLASSLATLTQIDVGPACYEHCSIASAGAKCVRSGDSQLSRANIKANEQPIPVGMPETEIECVLNLCYGHEAVTDKMADTRARLPLRRTGFNPRPGHRIFASGNYAGRWRWSAGFLGDLPPPLHSGAAPYSHQLPSSDLKTSLLRAAQISSLTHSVFHKPRKCLHRIPGF